MDSIIHQDQLAHIAHDYYLSKLSITELSKKYQLSRYLITKSLDEALASGLVSIQINSPMARNFQLETAVKKQFGIPHVAIMKDPNDPGQDSSSIIEFAAEQIQLVLRQSHIVGVTWGSTVFDVVDHFHNELRDDLTFTQFLGENMKYNSASGSTRMVEKAAAKFEANYLTIPAPLYVVNDAIRTGLPQEPALKRTFAAANRMDFLFCGMGTVSSIDSIPQWHQSKKEIFPGVDFSDIAGILFGRPYDISGHFLLPEADKTLGVSLDNILATPRRLAIIKSKFKTNAALGALRGHMITDLVMNESIAQRILAEVGLN
ncbi:MAG: sugar-binding transcriptional regulator [Lactobacillus sp.]|jgi:DNA-binding transcriptional regulator LsrR (DeoR family)|nr:sugar-binding transcriptional regulator [Lactobacillus sp.]